MLKPYMTLVFAVPSSLGQCADTTATWSSTGANQAYLAKIIDSSTRGQTLETTLSMVAQVNDTTSAEWCVWLSICSLTYSLASLVLDKCALVCEKYTDTSPTNTQASCSTPG